MNDYKQVIDSKRKVTAPTNLPLKSWRQTGTKEKTTYK